MKAFQHGFKGILFHTAEKWSEVSRAISRKTVLRSKEKNLFQDGKYTRQNRKERGAKTNCPMERMGSENRRIRWKTGRGYRKRKEGKGWGSIAERMFAGLCLHFRVVQRLFQYFLAFQLAQDTALHMVEHLYKTQVHFFFFRGMRGKGVDENKRNILQVPPATRAAKKAFRQASIPLGNGADGVGQVFIHRNKGGN